MTDCWLGFLFKAFPAFGAGNADFSLTSRDADFLTAAGAGVVTVLPVAEGAEQLQKLLILRPASVDITGVHPENCQNERKIGQKAEPVQFGKAAQQGEDHPQQHQASTKLIAAISPVHEPPETVTQFTKHLLSPPVSIHYTGPVRKYNI